MTAGRAAVAPLVVVAALTGCGGDDSRDKVADYIEDANAVQKRFAPAFKEANAAFKAGASGKLPDRAQLASLERAGASIGEARRKVAALEPPAEAARLHRELLTVFDLDVRLTREVTELAHYATDSPKVLAPLERSGRELRKGLTASAGASGQVRALDAYSGALRAIARRLDELDVPVVLRPTHRAQVQRLLRIRKVTRRLRGAVARADAAAIATQLLRFRRLSGRAAPNRAALARRGVAAYQALQRRLDRAEQRLVREQQRLNREVS